MKVDFSKEVAADSFIGWAICCLVDHRDIKGVFPTPESQRDAEVKLTVNGVELDFYKVMNRLIEDFDRQVNEGAIKLLDERFNDGFSQLTEDLEQLRRHLREKFNLPEREW